MQQIKSSEDLKSAIKQLEHRQANEYHLLKEEFTATYESLKPINFIKKAFENITTSPDIKDNLLGAAIGSSAGYLIKTLFVGASAGPIKQIFGAVFQFVISNVIAQKSESISKLTETILAFFNKKKGNDDQAKSDHVEY